MIKFTILVATLLTTMQMMAKPNNSDDLIDFGESGCGSCDWFVVVDGVMGGRSTGELASKGDSVVFRGEVSLENQGGFSSIRTPDARYDLSLYRSLVIRYRTIGQSFALTLKNDREYFKPKYQFVLASTEGAWSVKEVEFNEFEKVRLGETVGGSPTLDDLRDVIRLGIISRDKVAGKFELEVDYIQFNRI